MAVPQIAFNARATFTWSGDRMYRVYLTNDALYFIRIGGQGGMDVAVAAGFGALGGAALSLMRKRGQTKEEERRAAIDAQGPQALLDAHKHNFRLFPSDVRESSIEPAAAPGWHGPHSGRWLVTTGEQKLSLQFETPEDMVVALAHLPRLLGDRLRVNVAWSEKKGRFERPRT